MDLHSPQDRREFLALSSALAGAMMAPYFVPSSALGAAGLAFESEGFSHALLWASCCGRFGGSSGSR